MTMAGIPHASELAAAIRVRPQTVNKWMHCDHIMIRSDTLFRLCAKLHVSIRWLLFGTGSITPRPMLTEAEVLLIARYRTASAEQQAQALACLTPDEPTQIRTNA